MKQLITSGILFFFALNFNPLLAQNDARVNQIHQLKMDNATLNQKLEKNEYQIQAIHAKNRKLIKQINFTDRKIYQLECALYKKKPYQSEQSSSQANINDPIDKNDLIDRPLEGYLPLPKHNSNYQGNVKVNIIVNQNGDVIKAYHTSENSETEHQVLIQAAIEAAKKAKFITDLNAPKTQKGFINYCFERK